MSLFSKPQKRLSRGLALMSVPQRLPYLRRDEADGNKTEITVHVSPAKWVQMLGGKSQIERTYRLDSIGYEVYQACDGKRTVKKIVRDFATSHKISVAEAEIAVTSFLKTMIQKGLVAIAIEPKK